MKNEILEVDKLEGSIASLDKKPSLMEMALSSGADIAVIERLVALQEKENDRVAERDFIGAMSYFKTKCPIIKKLKKGHNCSFAGLDDIAEQIKGVLFEAGLTYRFEQEHTEKEIVVRCIASHKSGHSESCEMRAPADTSGSKNSVQAIGSTNTYLRRYTLTGVLGIATADQDIDGRLPEKEEEKVYSAEAHEMVQFNLEEYGKSWDDLAKIIKSIIGREEAVLNLLDVQECEKVIRFLEKKKKGKK